MERQRLARLAATQKPAQKRELPESPTHIGRTASPAKKTRTAPPSETIANHSGHSSVTTPFRKGAIKRTWALGYERHNDIKLEEILDKSRLQLALFSSFIWDGEWLMRKLDTRKTRIMMAMQAKDEQTVGFKESAVVRRC
jgi:hypothetical protein